jgi:hypothetical protein
MTRHSIARRYAVALLDVVASNDYAIDLEQVENDLARFQIERGPRIREALRSPAVPHSRKEHPLREDVSFCVFRACPGTSSACS